jgi:hypothetical protein
VITKHLKKGMEPKLLRLIYKKYIARFGRGVRHIHEFPILLTYAEVYLPDMPELRELQGEMARDLFIDVMKELEASGYVVFDKKTSFFLTAEGYAEAGKSRRDRTLDFFNRNQGLAVPISVVSLIVAIVALFG